MRKMIFLSSMVCVICVFLLLNFHIDPPPLELGQVCTKLSTHHLIVLRRQELGSLSHLPCRVGS